MDELEVGRIVLLWLWCFGLACIEIEIEGGYGWAERLPTWWLSRGIVGRIYAIAMGHRPLTGYHVFAFTIPLLILHLPYDMGVEWTLGEELRTIATFFALAVIWDYLWFVLNPAYTVARFKRGNVWWFEVPWIWRFPLDYYSGIGLSVALAALAAVADGDGRAAAPPPAAARRARGADRDRGPAGAAVSPLVPPHAPRRRRRPRQRPAPTRRRPPTRPGRAACPSCRRSSGGMADDPAESRFAIRLSSVDDLFEPYDARPVAERPLNYDARTELLDAWERSRDSEPEYADPRGPRGRARDDRRAGGPDGDRHHPRRGVGPAARRRPAARARIGSRRWIGLATCFRLHRRLDRARPSQREPLPPGPLAGDPAARLGGALGSGGAPGDRDDAALLQPPPLRRVRRDRRALQLALSALRSASCGFVSPTLTFPAFGWPVAEPGRRAPSGPPAARGRTSRRRAADRPDRCGLGPRSRARRRAGARSDRPRAARTPTRTAAARRRRRGPRRARAWRRPTRSRRHRPCRRRSRRCGRRSRTPASSRARASSASRAPTDPLNGARSS